MERPCLLGTLGGVVRAATVPIIAPRGHHRWCPQLERLPKTLCGRYGDDRTLTAIELYQSPQRHLAAGIKKFRHRGDGYLGRNLPRTIDESDPRNGYGR